MDDFDKRKKKKKRNLENILKKKIMLIDKN